MLEFIFQIAVLIMSVVIHEVSHGFVADLYGDPTARLKGRLTLNPLKHLDMVGSLLVPAVSFFLGGFIFGWAKPVPYNPYNLNPGRWPETAVAGAGPVSNLLVAFIFSALLRIGMASGWSEGFIHITALVVFVNILLAVFNLMPIPPLDGSRLLFALFPDKLYRFRNFFERYGFVLVFIFFVWQFVEPVVDVIYRILTGLPL
ncbi:site-2 protease family protein [Candidatus Parcubacteria bacterium]|nr:site-2 protease family protein [Candidatus Parcubacteria bacterium]